MSRLVQPVYSHQKHNFGSNLKKVLYRLLENGDGNSSLAVLTALDGTCISPIHDSRSAFPSL